MGEFIPAEAFPPSEYLSDELEARGWTAETFAELSGMSTLLVERLLTGDVKVKRTSAHHIAKAFGQDADTWMNLQASYDRHCERQETA